MISLETTYGKGKIPDMSTCDAKHSPTSPKPKISLID